jgi:hypothetical protein
MPAWESDYPIRRAHFSVSSPFMFEDPYQFPYYMLGWTVTIAIMGFVIFPWAMLAYKIRHGNTPIDEEIREELLQRSWYSGWALGGAALVVVLLDYLCADKEWIGFPPGPVHLVFLIAFLALAAWWMMYFFSLEDFFQGLMLTTIYIYLPAALCVVTWGHRWNLLFVYVLTWLKDPKP